MEVRRLYFLELEDNVKWEDPGPYIHIYRYPEGGEQHVAYILTDFDEVPAKPTIVFELTQPGTEQYAFWERYNLYQAILLHEQNRAELREDYLKRCTRYILEHCVQEPVQTPQQFEELYRKALCPEVGEEDLIAVLANTFPGLMERYVSVESNEQLETIRRRVLSNTTLGATIDDKARP